MRKRIHPYPHAKILHERFTYDANIDKLRWRKPPANNVKLLGTIAGSIDNNDRFYITVNNIKYRESDILRIFLTGDIT